MGTIARMTVCVAAAALAAGGTVGCGGKRPPVAAMAKAELAVQDAAATTASEHAELELRLAREKLDKARHAMEDDDYEAARWLAEEALVDAQLAEARAESEEAREAASRVVKSVETLQSETTR